MHNFDTVIRAFKIFNGFDGPSSDELWWRTDEEYAPLTLFVNCNDLFWWGCSDCEELTPDDFDDLEAAIADAAKAGDKHNGHLLWVARKRKMRPQGACYAYFTDSAHELFHQCGPEREVERGNPRPPMTREETRKYEAERMNNCT